MQADTTREKVIFDFYTQLFMTMGSFAASLNSNYSITASQARILRIIDLKPGLTLKEIVNTTHLNKGNCSSLCNTLAERGLIERARQSEDRRRVEHRLTEEGKETLEKFFSGLLDIQKPIFDSLSEEETAELMESIKYMTKYLNQVEDVVKDRINY